jgi:hypothetical protein
MKAIGLLCAALMIGACYSSSGPTTNFGVAVAPTPSDASLVFLEPVIPTATCVNGHVLITDVTLIVSAGTSSASLDRVTLRLIDGSSVGGPTITFPQAQLTSLFGSTVVVGTRRLTFNTQFTCGSQLPQSIAADVVLVARGTAAMVSAGAKLQ